MNMALSTRRLIAWIASFAMLMLTLAPSISNALASDSQSSWTEVCSSVGIKVVKTTSQTDSNAPGKGSLHFEHCPYCCTHAGSFAIPVTAIPSVPAEKTNFPFPQLYYQSSTPLFAWSTAQPRAPPSLI